VLDSLRIFHLVATTRSFTRAARQASLTRPAVSQHIKRLERHFRTQLLTRTTRRVELTPAGSILLQHVARVLEEVARMEQAMEEWHRQRALHLVIGASTLPGEYLLPGTLAHLRTRFPEADVRIHVGDTDQVLRWVREGVVEVGFIGRWADEPDLRIEPLMEDEIVLLLPTDHPLVDEIPPERLLDLPLVMREPGSATRATVLVALARHGVMVDRLRVVAEMGSPEAVKAAVHAGIGAGFVARLCLRPDEQRFTRLQGIPLRRPVCAVWREDRPLGELAQALVDAMRRACGSE
jgi:DNA-binding transcriptional LysR family regulator